MPRTPLSPGSYGQPSVRRSPNKKGWVARIKIRLLSGVYTEVERTRRLQADAITAAQEAAREKINAGGGFSAEGVTSRTKITDALGAYIDSEISNPGTQRVYRSVIRLHVEPAMRGLVVAELTPPLADRFLRSLSQGTRRTTKALLSGCWRWLASQGIVASNPIPLTSKAPPMEEVQERRYSTPEETRALVTAARSYHLHWVLPALMLYATTGLRREEIAQIRREDLEADTDTGQAYLTVTRLKTRGKKTDRIAIPIATYAVCAVQAVRTSGEGSPWLFPGRYDPTQHMRGESIYTGLVRFLEWARDPQQSGSAITPETRATLPKKFAPRDMRRGAATLLEDAVGLKAATAQLGHSSSAITVRHYIHKTGEVDNRATLEVLAREIYGLGGSDSSGKAGENGERNK